MVNGQPRSFTERLNKYKLIIFDKDGTLCGSTNPKGPPNTLEEQTMLPGVVDICNNLRRDGIILAIASNQGGVSLGYMTRGMAKEVVNAARVAVGAQIAFFAPDHPEAELEDESGLFDRKPNPGMLINAMVACGAYTRQTLYVGDRPEDEQAAMNAGVDFMWAEDFFANFEGGG